MLGKAAAQATMLTAVTPYALVPQGHPIRRIKPMKDRALSAPTLCYLHGPVHSQVKSNSPARFGSSKVKPTGGARIPAPSWQSSWNWQAGSTRGRSTMRTTLP